MLSELHASNDNRSAQHTRSSGPPRPGTVGVHPAADLIGMYVIGYSRMCAFADVTRIVDAHDKDDLDPLSVRRPIERACTR